MQASGDLEAASVAGAASASAGLPSPPPGPADGSAAQPPPTPGKEEGETSEPAEATLTEYLTEADVEKLVENKEFLVRCLTRASQRNIFAAFNAWRTSVVLANLMASMGGDDDDDEDS
mmetsp:Transcript_12152/g.28466  ORF Transcript_12152/g.28466 Transcript_12152/m.28466 type:complete len:118 (-) Transcript_12152:55-408(-)